jgi:hypothetical protein
MSISDLNNDDYDRGWMDGRDSAEEDIKENAELTKAWHTQGKVLIERKREITKLQAVLKDIAYSGIHMTVGEIRERALDAIKELER